MMKISSEHPELTMIGRASVKIKTTDGTVIYIDPYAGDDEAYSETADYILVTHQHDDHNEIGKVTQTGKTRIISCPVNVGAGDAMDYEGLGIKAVGAYNRNHPKGSGCGYLLSFDGIVLYHSGDTSKIDEMTGFKNEKITYALLCSDGYYNMGPSEVMEVADLIKAKYVIPIHTGRSGDYNQVNDEAVALENARHMKPGDTLVLEP